MAFDELLYEKVIQYLLTQGIEATKIVALDEEQGHYGWVTEVFYRDKNDHSKLWLYQGHLEDLIKELHSR